MFTRFMRSVRIGFIKWLLKLKIKSKYFVLCLQLGRQIFITSLYCRVNMEEMNPARKLRAMEKWNISDPDTYAANYTHALIDNTEFQNGLTRYDCIYIYSGK